MEAIKRYSSDHFNHYLEKAEELIDGSEDVDQWIKKVNDKNLLIWLTTLRRLKNDDNIFFQEIAIFLTVLIKLFILELGINDSIKLNDDEIKKLVSRFEYVIKREYANRHDIEYKSTTKYTLLK